MKTFVCKYCNKSFQNYNNRKYCSHKCYCKGKIKIVTSNCKICKKQIIDNKKRVVCNPQCQSKLPPWNLGLTKETDQRVRINGERTSKGSMGKKISKETIKKMLKTRKGYRHNIKTRRKLSKAHIGDKNPQWKGGISFEPYGREFNKKLKKKIKKRDNFTCQLCNEYIPKYISQRKHLVVHHIDYNKKNNREDNLIALCNFCNASVNTLRDEWTRYFQNKMGGQYG